MIPSFRNAVCKNIPPLPASRNMRAEAGAFTGGPRSRLGLQRQAAGQERTTARKNFRSRFEPASARLRPMRIEVFCGFSPFGVRFDVERIDISAHTPLRGFRSWVV